VKLSDFKNQEKNFTFCEDLRSIRLEYW